MATQSGPTIDLYMISTDGEKPQFTRDCAEADNIAAAMLIRAIKGAKVTDKQGNMMEFSGLTYVEHNYMKGPNAYIERSFQQVIPNDEGADLKYPLTITVRTTLLEIPASLFPQQPEPYTYPDPVSDPVTSPWTPWGGTQYSPTDSTADKVTIPVTNTTEAIAFDNIPGAEFARITSEVKNTPPEHARAYQNSIFGPVYVTDTNEFSTSLQDAINTYGKPLEKCVVQDYQAMSQRDIDKLFDYYKEQGIESNVSVFSASDNMVHTFANRRSRSVTLL